MLTPYSRISTCAVFFVLFLISQGEPQVFAPAPLRAQASSSRSLQPPLPPQSAPAAPEMRDVRELFRQHCTKCHGADGTGSQVRSCYPEIPDFTNAPWQARRADARLMASILDGKGSEMPPQRGRISEEQARGLVAHVRGFAPTREKPNSVRHGFCLLPLPAHPKIFCKSDMLNIYLTCALLAPRAF